MNEFCAILFFLILFQLSLRFSAEAAAWTIFACFLHFGEQLFFLPIYAFVLLSLNVTRRL